MSQFARITLFLSRISLGWVFFYAGITKVLNPEWTAAGFLKGAKTGSAFFQMLLDPSVLPYINFLNKWGLLLIGISLLIGALVRVSSLFGAALMVLYYIPRLDGFNPDANSFIVDLHIVYFFVLLYFVAIGAGRVYGLEKWCSSWPICKRFPKLRALLG